MKIMKTIIRQGTIVSPSEIYEADILIDGEKIACIGRNLESEGAKVIEARGKYVIPGGVDVHTHMDLLAGNSRAVDDFYDGTVAAACGGTTAIVDHMGFGPDGCNLHYQLNEYHHLADGKAVIDYGFHGTAQHVNQDILDELEGMMEDGVSSVKVYLTYDRRLNDGEALQVLKRMKKLGGVTAFHCENHEVVEYYRNMYREQGCTSPYYHAKSRPNLAEAEAVARILSLARLAGDAPVYIVHLSCKESLEAVLDARKKGQKNIFVETCTQYLTLTEERYMDKDGLKYVMSPPLRTREDCERLWEGLAAGDIQVVATDHCPFNYGIEKQLGRDDFTKCPNGAPGVEERMSVIFSEGVMKKRISLNRYVEALCTNPARIYGFYPEKGILQPGSGGDLVIIDPKKEYVLTHDRMHSAVDYTAYEGMKLKGQIELVMQRGSVVAEGNVFKGKRGAGRFIHRRPHDNA